jgi:hypothetical protein
MGDKKYNKASGCRIIAFGYRITVYGNGQNASFGLRRMVLNGK